MPTSQARRRRCADKTELDALVAYLQGLGVRPRRRAAARGDAMSALWGHLIGVMIVLLMLVFIGIWIWAWLPHHKNAFDDAGAAAAARG